MRLARMQHRLFANHPIAINKVHDTAPVSDPPVAGEQLRGLIGVVLNANVINPEPLASVHARLFGQKVHCHTNSDPIGDRGMLE